MKASKKKPTNQPKEDGALISLDHFRVRANKSIPTAFELAQLAALLSGQMPAHTTDSNLAERAYSIWKACTRLRKDKIESAALYEEATQIGRLDSSHFSPSFRDASLSDFLKATLPSVRKNKRMAIFEKSERDKFQKLHRREATEQEIHAVLNQKKRSGIAWDEYEQEFQWLRAFAEQNRKSNLGTRGKAGSAALQAKRLKLKNTRPDLHAKIVSREISWKIGIKQMEREEIGAEKKNRKNSF